MTHDEMLALADDAERLAEAATPGPWEPGGPYPSVSVIYQVDAGTPGPYAEPPMWEPVCKIHDGSPDWQKPPLAAVNDAEFIAVSRTLVPQLTAALREAVAECERLRGELTQQAAGLPPGCQCD